MCFLWWCKIIAQHGFIFLLLLATSQFWYHLSDSVIIIQESRIKPGINITRKVTVYLFQTARVFIEPVVWKVISVTVAVVNLTI
jgi:hypothetical protein